MNNVVWRVTWQPHEVRLERFFSSGEGAKDFADKLKSASLLLGLVTQINVSVERIEVAEAP